MNTSPAHDLTEPSDASHHGSHFAALTANRLSTGIRHRQPRGWVQVWLIFVACWLSGCGSAPTPEATLSPRELKTDAERLSLVGFSPDGKQLVAGDANGVVLVWKDVTGPPMKLDSGRSSPLLSLTWSSDGLLAVTDLGRGFFGWQFGAAEPVRVEQPRLPSPAVCLAFRPHASSLEFVLGMRDGSLIFVDPRGSKQLKPDHRGAVKQAVYSADGQWLITAGADGQLIWRNAATRNAVHVVKAHETEISRLRLSTDGKQLISGDWNGRLKVWDPATRESPGKFEQPDAVSGLEWVRGELVSASWDGSLRGWDVSSGRCVRTFSTGQPIHDLSADSHTSRVATVSLDRVVRLWDWPAPATKSAVVR